MLKPEKGSLPLIRIAGGVAMAIAALLGASSAGAQTPVSACGTIISASGSYVLNKDLNCSGDGVDITTSSVDFNLNGHRISSSAPGTIGINLCVSGAVNSVTIRNGAVEGFDEEVCIAGGEFFRFTGLQLGGSSTDIGIKAIGTTNSSFDSNVITGIATGILLDDAFGNNIFLNRINNCGTGVEVLSAVTFARNNSIFDNELSSNSDHGVLFVQGANGAVFNNAVSNNKVERNGTGIEIVGMGNVIVGNTAKMNAVVDLQDDSHGCTDNIWLSNIFKTANPSCIQ